MIIEKLKRKTKKRIYETKIRQMYLFCDTKEKQINKGNIY